MNSNIEILKNILFYTALLFICYQLAKFWYGVIKNGYTRALIEHNRNMGSSTHNTSYYAEEDSKYSYKDIINRQYPTSQTQQPLTGIPKALSLRFNGEKDINKRQPFTQEKIDYAQIPDERVCANNMFTDCSALPANSNSDNLFDPYSNTSSAYSLHTEL